MTNDIHVLPVDDVKEHIEDESCECKPTVKYESGGRVIVHNSWDGREFLEKWEEEKGKVLQ